MKQKCKSALSLALAAVLIFGSASPPASAADAAFSAEKMGAGVSAALIENVPKGGLKLGRSEGDWTAVALARAGCIASDVYGSYYSNVAKEVKSCKGVLSENKYTEYSRVILGLTAVGRDPRTIGGYDLVQPLADYEKVIHQGTNGPIWALIALDSGEYDVPKLKGSDGTQNSRERMVDAILSDEIGKGTASVGGWALSGSEPDPDITAMALQALSNYRSRSDVQAAVGRAVKVLSKLQNSRGGYSSWGTENSESTAQVVVALTGLGISPDSKDFVKNGHTLISALAEYYLPGEGFKHLRSDSSPNGMATDQCACAVAAYNRFQSKQNPLYDMSDTVVAGENSGTPTFVSDTTENFSVSGSYLFKITSKNGKVPAFAVGTPGVFAEKLAEVVGGNYYFQIKAIGSVGAKAGIYINGKKVVVAEVGD